MAGKTLTVKDDWGFEGTVKDAILNHLSVSAAGYTGQIEDIQSRVSNLEDLIARYLASKIKTVDELNDVTGYEKYTEVSNG